MLFRVGVGALDLGMGSVNKCGVESVCQPHDSATTPFPLRLPTSRHVPTSP